ncbi:UDP-N-acetylmuramate--L-alanine ligase [Planctomycetales bacterium ZRK34]|nr:UDP-N-acetylmuramate--L-alanine ligase [Planctomycetales bacterium ZRK34]
MNEPLLTSDPNAPLDLRQRHVHFVGIGGCGMSGLARIARHLGAICTGTDAYQSPFTDALTLDGIEVTLRQEADCVPAEADLIVASAAIRAEHPEIVEARRRNLPVLKYAQLLGRLMLGRTGVAIAGTHGKSTTTAMLAHTLIATEQDPSFIVGATCKQIGGGARAGRKDVLIGEACEFDRSFHNFHPTHAVVLNVEEDHLDIYGSIDAIIEAFRQFAQKTHPDGTLLIAHDGAYRTAVAAGLDCAVETIGFAPQADWHIKTGPGLTVQLHHDGQIVCAWKNQLPGEHMAYNSAVAAVTAHRLGAPWEGIGNALTTFSGLDRRMQNLGEHQGVTVVDDYGHHPTEIDTTLRALRSHHLSAKPDDERSESSGSRTGRLICVFQPHQHSRTRFLLDQFATSFSQADIVIVPHIYFVRDSEEDRRAVSAADLVHRLQQRGVIAEHIDAFEDIVAHLHQITRPGDLLVVMGAGPVWKVAHQFIHPQQ